jgi:hypothetical protein
MAMLVALCLAGILSNRPAVAGDLDKLDCSLKLIPADAAFYSSSLRNKEQIEIIANSRAWAKLKSMPAVQMGLIALQAQLNDPNPQLAPFVQLYKAPENQQLLELLGDLASREIFIYGGESVIGFAELFGEVTSQARFGSLAQLGAMSSGQDAGKVQGRTILRFLASHPDLIRLPDVVIGFKLTKKEAAETQLKRLEDVLKNVTQQVLLLAGHINRAKVGRGEFLVLTLDGSMIPWDKVPYKDLEEKEGEFDELIKKLKNLKLTISLGTQDGYLLFAIGESTSALEKLGSGSHLADQADMKILEKHASQRLVSISYTSQAFRAKIGTNKKDIARMADFAAAALKNLDLSAEQRAKIQKDLGDLAKDIEPYIPNIGASVSCSYLTGHGYEGYSYDWTELTQYDASKPLTLLNHVGGSPLLAFVGRGRQSPEGFQTLRKWLKKVPGYVDEFVLPRLGEDAKEQYQRIAKLALPILERLGNATETMLIPALADGQFGFVLDAKITSKQWHKALPASDKPLPMLEPAFVVGVSDAALLTKAFTEYRSIANETIAKLHEMFPDKIPEFQIPEPQSRKLKTGTSYFYPLPSELGVDEKISPNGAVSDNVAALAITQDHAERLLANTPLKVESGPLADLQKPMASAAYVHCEGIVQVLAPWVDYGIRAALQARGAEVEDSTKMIAEMVKSHVATALEVLQVFRSYSSSTYLEDKITVTHSVTVIRDVQ